MHGLLREPNDFSAANNAIDALRAVRDGLASLFLVQADGMYMGLELQDFFRVIF